MADEPVARRDQREDRQRTGDQRRDHLRARRATPRSCQKIAGQTIGPGQDRGGSRDRGEPAQDPGRWLRSRRSRPQAQRDQRRRPGRQQRDVDRLVQQIGRDRRKLPPDEQRRDQQRDRPDRVAAQLHRDARQEHGGQRDEQALQEQHAEHALAEHEVGRGQEVRIERLVVERLALAERQAAVHQRCR